MVIPNSVSFPDPTSINEHQCRGIMLYHIRELRAVGVCDHSSPRLRPLPYNSLSVNNIDRENIISPATRILIMPDDLDDMFARHADPLLEWMIPSRTLDRWIPTPVPGSINPERPREMRVPRRYLGPMHVFTI